MAPSSSSTRLASCSSESSTAWTDWCTARSARLPIQSRRSFNSFRSFSKWRSMNPSGNFSEPKNRFLPPRRARNDNQKQCFQNNASAKAAGDVSLRPRITGRGEELWRGAELNELPNKQEGREVTDARRLLHVVCNSNDGTEIFQLYQKLFDTAERSLYHRYCYTQH